MDYQGARDARAIVNFAAKQVVTRDLSYANFTLLFLLVHIDLPKMNGDWWL